MILYLDPNLEHFKTLKNISIHSKTIPQLLLQTKGVPFLFG